MLVYLQMIETPEDRSKFEKVYLEYKGLMYYVAYDLLKNEQDAEDAVHNAFVNIAEHIERVDIPISDKTKSLVVTIVERRAIEIYRAKNKREIIEYDDKNIGLQVEYNGSFELARCLAQLPPNYRHVLFLKHRHGYTNKEIAQIMNTSEANAIKLEQRAKAKLLKLCKQEDLL